MLIKERFKYYAFAQKVSIICEEIVQELESYKNL